MAKNVRNLKRNWIVIIKDKITGLTSRTGVANKETAAEAMTEVREEKGDTHYILSATPTC